MICFALAGTLPALFFPALRALAQTRQERKEQRYKWYQLSDAQDAALRKALFDFRIKHIKILVLSATSDSLSLAEDFDSAFNDVGLHSHIDRPMDVVDGCHTNSAALAGLIEKSTHIRCTVHDTAGSPDVFLMFGRKQ